MTDLRDNLIAEIHRAWLKPLGFRKSGRKCTKAMSNDITVEVSLKSYPTAPEGPFRFSIDISANSLAANASRIYYVLMLPFYTQGAQFWAFDSNTNQEELQTEIIQEFKEIAVPSIDKMNSYEGIQQLFATIPSRMPLFWYFESYYNCLDRNGCDDEKIKLLQKVIETAPHDGVKNKAQSMLEAVAH